MYAILGPRGKIFNLVAEQPEDGRRYILLTPEQLAIVGEETEPKPYFIIDGNLLTEDEARPLLMAMRPMSNIPDPNKPYAVSKIKLLRALDSRGLYDPFISFLNSDPKILMFFNSCQVLMTNDPLLVDAIPAFVVISGMTDNDVMIMLSECRD